MKPLNHNLSSFLMPQSARAIAMFHAKQASSSRRRLVSVLVLFLSLLAQASWAQTVVNVSNGTDLYSNEALGKYHVKNFFNV